MKTVMTAILLVAAMLFLSCDLFDKEDYNGQEPSYTAKIAWDCGLVANSYRPTILDGDYVYFFERPEGYSTVGIYTLTKLEAVTGKLVWRTIKFTGIQFCQPAALGDYIYVFLQPNEILCFQKETGELSATVRVDIENKNLEMEWNGAGYGGYLYLCLYNSSSKYFARLNVNSIGRGGNPETMQALTPEILWQPETRMNVKAKPIIYNNTVYTGTYGNSAGVIEVAGFDIDSKAMVFHTTLGIDENGIVYDKGGLSNPIFIHDGILYYLSWSISAYSLATGGLLYRHTFEDGTKKTYNEKAYIAYSLQPVFYNGKIYYTSGSCDSEYGYRNIHCIDAKTGKLVWNAIAKDSESLDTNPIIAHNRLYVSQYSGLRVYNPENGKLIGVDKSFCGAGMGRNLLYNDYLICIRKNDDNDGKLVAVYVGK